MAGFNLGDIFVTFKAKTEDLERGIDKVKQGVNSVESTVNNTSFRDFAQKSITALGDIGRKGWTVLAATAAGALAFIGSRINDAVNRIDTLVNFPKVLTAMGSTAAEAKESTDKLSKSLQGLPTALQQGAAGVQQLVAAGLTVPKATDAFLAMNNALIAGGANAQDTQIVMDSLTRAISAGTVDASTLQAALSRMPTVLQALSKESGLSADELFRLYANDPQKLIDDMIRLNQQGTGSIMSLEKQAREATGGIGTSFTNLGNAIDRSWQAIVTAVGGGDLEKGQEKISNFIAGIGKKIESSTKKMIEFGQKNKAWLEPLVIVLGAAAAGVVALAMAVALLQFVLSPVVLIGAAVIGLIAGLVLLNEKFGWVNKTLQFMAPIWQGLAAIFTKYILPSLTALGNTLSTQLLPALMQIWGAVVKLWNALNPGLTDALKVIGVILGAVFVGAVWLAINALNMVVQVLSWMVSGVTNLIGWISNLIGWFGNLVGVVINTVGTVLGWFGKIPGAVGGIVNSVVGWFKDLPSRIGSALSGVEAAITGPFKAAFNAIASFWNKTVSKASFKAPDWVPGIGGKGWSIPDMPHLAMGTPNWRGGAVNMNEFGPETAVLPPGTKVLTAEQTRQGSGQGNTYHITVKGAMARSESELADIMEEGIKALDRRLGGAGRPQIMGGRA